MENTGTNIRETLNLILTLQKNSCCNTECEGCTRPFLGFSTIQPFNTRLVTFYRCDNTPLTLPYIDATGATLTTSIFRVQNVSCNTATLLLLADNGDGTYTNTNTFATINLNCVCAIQCLGDTTITNI